MPGHGDQHQAGATLKNPFEESKPQISEYTAQEIATLSSRLEKQLGPEYISSRPGASGQRVHYVAGDKCINLANEVFGFNGWSTSIQNVQIDFVDENPQTGKVSLGLSVIIRVTLRDGTFHEDIGYGSIENCKGKAPAFEKAKKEGTTDALKRTLRNFGKVLGNCVYDKDYLAKVTKLKIAPSKWDPENLHRHADYAPARRASPPARQPQAPEPVAKRESRDPEPVAEREPRDPEDEYGGDEFDEVDFAVSNGDHPDEIALENSASSEPSKSNLPNGNPNPRVPTLNHNEPQIRPLERNTTSGTAVMRQIPYDIRSVGDADAHTAPQIQSGAQKQFHSQLNSHRQQTPPALDAKPVPYATRNNRPNVPLPNLQDETSKQQGASGTPPINSSNSLEHEPPVGFYTARVAESVQKTSNLPLNAASFNPHLDSPSIRKTAGVDHTKTKPVGREVVGAPAPAPISRPNFVNPQVDKARRIGQPLAAASPLLNRSSYRPPQMKRPAESPGDPNSRSALGDVTSASINVPPDIGGDSKRQKIGNQVRSVGSTESLTGR